MRPGVPLNVVLHYVGAGLANILEIKNSRDLDYLCSLFIDGTKRSDKSVEKMASAEPLLDSNL